MKISNVEISQKNYPFIIAEMSGNHNQSIEKALAIIDAAAKCGCDAVKIQTSTPEMLTLKSNKRDFIVQNNNEAWNNRSLYDLYTEAYTPFEWHKPLFDYAKEKNIILFSSPFGKEAVDILEKLDCPAYKIASFENNYTDLIKYAASTGKPIIISTGMASISDLEKMVNAVHSVNNSQLVLLKCTSTYPASATDINLLTIPHLQKMFGIDVGLSDHTMGIGVSIAATILGAVMIEKHFTLDRKEGGVDASFSMEPNEMAQLVIETKIAKESIGKIKYGPTKEEEKATKYRRSIYTSKRIKKGEKFTIENIKVVRPGFGLHPDFFEEIINKTAKIDIEEATALRWEHVL